MTRTEEELKKQIIHELDTVITHDLTEGGYSRIREILDQVIPTEDIYIPTYSLDTHYRQQEFNAWLKRNGKQLGLNQEWDSKK